MSLVASARGMVSTSRRELLKSGTRTAAVKLFVTADDSNEEKVLSDLFFPTGTHHFDADELSRGYTRVFFPGKREPELGTS